MTLLFPTERVAHRYHHRRKIRSYWWNHVHRMVVFNFVPVQRCIYWKLPNIVHYSHTKSFRPWKDTRRLPTTVHPSKHASFHNTILYSCIQKGNVDVVLLSSFPVHLTDSSSPSIRLMCCTAYMACAALSILIICRSSSSSRQLALVGRPRCISTFRWRSCAA